VRERADRPRFARSLVSTAIPSFPWLCSSKKVGQTRQYIWKPFDFLPALPPSTLPPIRSRDSLARGPSPRVTRWYMRVRSVKDAFEDHVMTAHEEFRRRLLESQRAALATLAAGVSSTPWLLS